MVFEPKRIVFINQYRQTKVGIKKSLLLPRDLQVELDGPQVVHIDRHHLRHGGKQLLGFADDAAHQHVRGEALQLRHLERSREKRVLPTADLKD